MAAVITGDGVFDRRPNVDLIGIDNPSDITHDDDESMTKADREELAGWKELVHQQAAVAALNAQAPPQVQVQTANPNKWLMASLAIVTLLGGSGAFIGNSGIWVGKKEQQSERVNEQVKKLEDQVEYLKTWNERLRNNMAAYGWLIDSTGDVSRIEQKSVKRRQ